MSKKEDLEKQLLRIDAEGNDFAKQNKMGEAVAKHTEAINLIESNKNFFTAEVNADAYNARGATYGSFGQTILALKDFERALRILPNHVTSLRNQTLLYEKEAILKYHEKNFSEAKERSRKALANCEKLFEILDKNVVPNAALATTYLHQFAASNRIREIETLEQSPNAIAGPLTDIAAGQMLSQFDRVNKYDSKIKAYFILCYWASQIKQNNPIRAPALRIMLTLYPYIERIQQILTLPLEERQRIAHYTNLHVVKKLVRGESLHMYNASYMNDPKEGEILSVDLDSANKNENGAIGPAVSQAFISSFVKIDGSEEKARELSFWRSYGKHDGEDAAGACLIFDASNVSNSPMQFNLAGMRKMQNSDPANEYSDPSYIFKVQYNDETNQDTLLSAIKNLEVKHRNILNNEDVYPLIQEIYHEIQFLFKSPYHAAEREIRIIALHPQDAKELKIDIDRHPPQFYVEAPKELELKKIIFGPQVKNYEEWAAWIKKYRAENKLSEIEVDRSNIPYGSRRQ